MGLSNEKERRREALFALVRESLFVYYDGPKPYLRFVPHDSEPFRHGLSINVKLDNDLSQREQVKDEVARYLASAFVDLWEEVKQANGVARSSSEGG